MPKETKVEKARRFVDGKRVKRVTAWAVEGDNDTYVVTPGEDSALMCTCPTQDTECSHMIAVALQMLGENN